MHGYMYAYIHVYTCAYAFINIYWPRDFPCKLSCPTVIMLIKIMRTKRQDAEALYIYIRMYILYIGILAGEE